MLWMLAVPTEKMPKEGEPIPQPSVEQLGDFYMEFGATIGSWQFVEASLIWIFSRIVNASNVDSLAAAFHVPTNFRVRLDMTNAAIAQAPLTTEIREEWNSLYDRAGRKAKRRNLLAHAIVMFEPARKRPQDQLFLAPNLSDPAKKPPDLGQGNIISVPELKTMREAFDSLNTDLTAFRVKLSARR